WTRTGPSGAKVTAMLALGGNVVLAGTGWVRGVALVSGRGGHLYRSSDDGVTFTEVAAYTGSTVNTLVRGPSGSIYAAVGSSSGNSTDGVYVSSDQGSTFTA